MSMTGMPSVMQMTVEQPASTASMIESAAKGAGTKMSETKAPVPRTASCTVLKTGRSRWVWPPRPGVTPATIWEPYSMHCLAWKVP